LVAKIIAFKLKKEFILKNLKQIVYLKDANAIFGKNNVYVPAF